MATDRTAPFVPIRDQQKTITHTVAVPGLTARHGGPLTVKRTYDLQEIEGSWVSVILDYEFGDAPIIYGDHPLAVGPLREILPQEFPLPPIPALRHSVRDRLVTMLVQQNLPALVVMPVLDSRTAEIRPSKVLTEVEVLEFYATVREYLPFQATVWWDDSEQVIRVRALPEIPEFPVVNFA